MGLREETIAYMVGAVIGQVIRLVVIVLIVLATVKWATGSEAMGGRFVSPYNQRFLPQIPTPKPAPTRANGGDPYNAYKKRFHKAVVQVNNLDGSSGTGFFIELDSGRKILVTAAHVCGTSKTLYSEKGMHQVLLVAPERDTCLLSTFQSVDTVNLARSDLKKGDYVSTTGFPLRLQWDFREGKAESIDLSFFYFPMQYYGACPEKGGNAMIDAFGGTVCGIGVTTFRVRMLVRPGNSGGPAFNIAGQIVGIVIATDREGGGYVVPVSDLKEVLSRGQY